MQCTNHASRIAQSRKAAIQRGDLPPTGRPIPQHTQATACAAMQRVDGVLQQVRAAGQGFVAPPQHTHPPARHTRPQTHSRTGPAAGGRIACATTESGFAPTRDAWSASAAATAAARVAVCTRGRRRGETHHVASRVQEKENKGWPQKKRKGSCHTNKRIRLLVLVCPPLVRWGGDGAVMGGGRISAGRGPLRVADVV